MGKVASTYLREAFFPLLRGAYFIPRSKKYQALSIMAAGEHDKYILCRALDANMEAGIKDIAAAYPATHPIIVFRRPDSWIASQYRRFVKNGFPGTLQEFVDIKDNQGFLDCNEMLFMQKIRLLERYFTARPLALFIDEMKEDPRSFFDAIAAYVGCDYDFEAVRLAPIHTSHNPKGLRFRRQVRRWFSRRMPRYTRIPVLHWLQRRALMVWAYLLIAIGNRLPESWIEDEPLMDEDYLAAIRQFAAADWAELQAYAAETRKQLAKES
jgi:hypothetical protein